MKLTDKDWNWIHRQAGTDILSMVMDFAHNRISAVVLMDKIAKHCQLAGEAMLKRIKTKEGEA